MLWCRMLHTWETVYIRDSGFQGRVLGLELRVLKSKGLGFYEVCCEHHDNSSWEISLPREMIFRWLIVRKRVRLSFMTQYNAVVIQKCN